MLKFRKGKKKVYRFFLFQHGKQCLEFDFELKEIDMYHKNAEKRIKSDFYIKLAKM